MALAAQLVGCVFEAACIFQSGALASAMGGPYMAVLGHMKSQVNMQYLLQSCEWLCF